MKSKNPAVFLRVFIENTDVDFIGVERVLEIAHIHAVTQRIGELLAVILLLKIGNDKILVPLIDILGAAARPLVDRVNHDIQNGLPQHPCWLTAG